MPKIYGKGTNFHGLKGRSGNKPDSVKINKRAEELLNTSMAKKLVNSRLSMLNELPIDKVELGEMKVVVMPIILKDMVEKQDHTTGGKPFPILANVSSNNSNQKDNADVQEIESNPRGDISKQDGINRPILDTPGAE